MIGFIAQNGQPPVDLLEKEQAGHQVRQGHGGEGKQQVSPLFDRVAQPVGAADDQSQLRRALDHVPAEQRGEVLRGKGLPRSSRTIAKAAGGIFSRMRLPFPLPDVAEVGLFPAVLLLELDRTSGR